MQHETSALRVANTNSTTKATKPKATKSVIAKPSAKVMARMERHLWSHTGVTLCVALSAGLNGYANSRHAEIRYVGAILGVMVPVLVLVLAKVAGMQFRAKKSTYLTSFTAISGLSLLALSVWHCAESLALLTGSSWYLALPMAIAIDCGLVACELDLVLG